MRKKFGQRKLFLISLGALCIGAVGVWAATNSETFSSAGNYVLSNASTIMIEPVAGVAKLTVQKPFYLQTGNNDFNGGTYMDTEVGTGDLGAAQSPVTGIETGLLNLWRLNETSLAVLGDSKGSLNGAGINTINSDWQAANVKRLVEGFKE